MSAPNDPRRAGERTNAAPIRKPGFSTFQLESPCVCRFNVGPVLVLDNPLASSKGSDENFCESLAQRVITVLGHVPPVNRGLHSSSFRINIITF